MQTENRCGDVLAETAVAADPLIAGGRFWASYRALGAAVLADVRVGSLITLWQVSAAGSARGGAKISLKQSR